MDINCLGYCRRQDSSILTAAFLFPEADDNDLFNLFVAKISRNGCCHVELVFEDDMAFSIFSKSNLFFRRRSFANPEYRLVSLNVSSDQYSKAYNFCTDAVKHDIAFNEIGIYTAYMQPCPMFYTGSSRDEGITFCSKIVTEALQAAGINEVDDLTPCTTTPSTLYTALNYSERKIGHSLSYKREQLRTSGAL